MSRNGDGYRYGFGGHENDNEVKGNGNHISFGDYGYDPRIGRRWNIDPLSMEYPWQSPFLSSDNNPIFFNDPNGKNAVGTISGNTITVSATVYVYNGGKNKLDIAKTQKAINSYWGKDFKYKDEQGKSYNVKFDITVKEITFGDLLLKPLSFEEGANYVYPKDGTFNNNRSNVANNMVGNWIVGKDDRTYSHEMGHLLGLADLYIDLECYNPFSENHGETRSVSYPSATSDELMSSSYAWTTFSFKNKDKKVTQRSINAIAEFVIKNQNNGKTVINLNTLPEKGLDPPTEEDEKTMKETYPKGATGWSIK